MRKFLMWLFETKEEPFDITLFSFWHILYFLIIVGTTFALAYYLNKHEDKKTTVLRLLVYALAIVYVADFFIQPLMRSDLTMNIDKLPFHICTVLCPVVAFAEFNSKISKFREPIAFLAVVAPLMYLVYPGTAIGEESPFCYEIIQTFVYHGLLFSWGINSIATGTVKPDIKNWYKSLIGICLIALWATVGNYTYNGADNPHHYDWFFLTGTTFPFVPTRLMPFVVIACVFGMVMIIYGIYYWVCHLMKKHAQNATDSPEREEKETANV